MVCYPEALISNQTMDQNISLHVGGKLCVSHVVEQVHTVKTLLSLILTFKYFICMLYITN